MTHHEIKELLPLYVVGGLEVESVTAIEQHLAQPCESCAAELREWQGIADLIPLGVTPAQPSDAIKGRLLDRIRHERGAKVVQLRTRRWRPRRWRPLVVGIPLAAAAALLLTFAGLRYQAALQTAADQQNRADQVVTLLIQEQEKLVGQEQERQQLVLQVQAHQHTTTEKAQQVARLEAALAAQQQRVSQQDQALARLRTQLAASTPVVAPSPKPGPSIEVAKYEREVEKLKTELAQVRGKLSENERSLQEVQTTLAQQRQQAEAGTRELVALREAVARQRGVIEVLTAPGLQVRPLRQAKSGVATTGHVLWNDQRKAWVFYAFGMPPVPEGKAYQVWFMTEKEGPVSAGLFSPDQDGVGQVLAATPSKFHGDIRAVAVTLEPAGGLPKPSGEMYLRGSL
jgi:anti-sigma-K factor RskA